MNGRTAWTPAALVPAHCTGWRAQHAVAARFGQAFVPNAVGTRFHVLSMVDLA